MKKAREYPCWRTSSTWIIQSTGSYKAHGNRRQSSFWKSLEKWNGRKGKKCLCPYLLVNPWKKFWEVEDFWKEHWGCRVIRVLLGSNLICEKKINVLTLLFSDEFRHSGPYIGQHLFHSKNPLKCVLQEYLFSRTYETTLIPFFQSALLLKVWKPCGTVFVEILDYTVLIFSRTINNNNKNGDQPQYSTMTYGLDSCVASLVEMSPKKTAEISKKRDYKFQNCQTA